MHQLSWLLPFLVIAVSCTVGVRTTHDNSRARSSEGHRGSPPCWSRATPILARRGRDRCAQAPLSFAAKERRLLGRNPVSDIRRKAEPRGRTRFLSDNGRARLLKACGESAWPALQALVLLAITTGARKGELIRLKWADVDLKTGRALVSETKNDEPRTLPLAGKALEALRALKLKESARSEYVFPQPSGLPGPYEHFDAHWYAALSAAGIEDFHFHDLRHTTASMLAAQGASMLEIADVLGHKTLAMVKRYSHLVIDHKAKVIEKMIAAKGL